MDEPFGGTAQEAYTRSGIAEAVRKAGGEMEIIEPHEVSGGSYPAGKGYYRWMVYGDVLDADVFINVP